MKLYQVTNDDFTETLNIAKEVLALHLEKDGVLTKEQALKITEEYALVAAPKSLLGKIIDTVKGRDKKDEDLRIFVVKVL